MTIDWNHFTPGASVAGGLLIGLAAAVFVLFNGRIAGISGILGGLLRPWSGGNLWRVVFLAGMLASPWIYKLFAALPDVVVAADDLTLVAGGLLVGLGTAYGAGCTSGHGVCGLSRLSPRSLVATLAFMGTGFVTVFVLRHVLGWSGA
jgi:hypothetical protein